MNSKTLTLAYDFFDNEFFKLNVINDETIELFHANSGTVYEFKGRSYIAYYRSSDPQEKLIVKEDKHKKRKQKTVRIDNPRENRRS